MRFHPGIIGAAQQDSSSSSSISQSSSTSSASTSDSSVSSRRRGTETLNEWKNSEQTGQYLSPVISIQRAWRSYRNSRPGSIPSSEVELTSDGYADGAWEKDDTTSEETDSTDRVQMMSLSTPEDSEQNLKIDDDPPSTEDLEEPTGPDRRSYSVSYSLAMRCGIDSDPESIVSDYSEMADPIKEHLANVQIIQKEDLDLGNTTFVDNFLVQTKIFRGSEEDEEQFNKRLRKTNYLSLAQEFAELKKVNASALPFGLHKEQYQTVSPLSESGSELDCSDPGYLGDSSEALSMLENGGSGRSEGESLNPRETGTPDLLKSDGTATFETGTALGSADMNAELNPVSNPQSDDAIPRNPEVPVADEGDGYRGNEDGFRGNEQLASAVSAIATVSGGGDSVIPNAESDCSCAPESPGKMQPVRRKMDESVGEFDIYTVETVLPQMDWQHLEEQLQRAAEEEQKKWSLCGDREQIRRKLAMPVEDDSTFDSDLLLRKPSLQTRLHANMNLHMCFVNEAAASSESTDVMARATGLHLTSAPQSSTPDVVPVQSQFLKTGATVDQDDKEDFFAKQARLQAEAKMALAQVRPMAHMQLQLEKQLKKKSPLAEIVGIPGFIDGKFRHLSKHLLLQMNLAQLQVVVNDLHAQIEVLNTELMQQLVDRDDLHMAQDSMLVDIEDLTGRAQEFAARVNKRAEKREFLK